MTLVQFVQLAQSEAAHFLLACFVGLLAYWLTWIISCAIWVLAHRGNHQDMSSVVAYGTTFIGLLLGLGFGVLSHLWLDGLSTWLSTPLGPHLIINK